MLDIIGCLVWPLISLLWFSFILYFIIEIWTLGSIWSKDWALLFCGEKIYLLYVNDIFWNFWKVWFVSFSHFHSPFYSPPSFFPWVLDPRDSGEEGGPCQEFRQQTEIHIPWIVKEVAKDLWNQAQKEDSQAKRQWLEALLSVSNSLCLKQSDARTAGSEFGLL